MRRRTFLELTGLGTLGAIAGCAEARTLPVDGGAVPESDAAAASDAAVAPDTTARRTAFVVAAFEVLLNDPSCSGHDHGFSVDAATYMDDTPVEFLGGSHLVAFRPSELLRMAGGEQLPFSTIGPGPGHGHCGIAFKLGAFLPSRDRVDACTTMSPPDGAQAVCEIRPHV